MMHPNNNSYQHQQPHPRNLVTAAGVVRCRFDMFIRWPQSAGRRINPFTMRGDNFGITEPSKMLCSLLRYFIKNHNKWILAELYDNSKPLNDPDRVVISVKDGKIEHRLQNYEVALQDFALPEWLKQNVEQK